MSRSIFPYSYAHWLVVRNQVNQMFPNDDRSISCCIRFYDAVCWLDLEFRL